MSRDGDNQHRNYVEIREFIPSQRTLDSIQSRGAPAAPNSARDESLTELMGTHFPPNDVVMLSDLHWWTTEDNIRHVSAKLGFHFDLSAITFSEHKVNGKSKGLVYLECGSSRNAEKLKKWFDGNQFQGRCITATLGTSAYGNPFRTLPKDPPVRAMMNAHRQPAHGTNSHQMSFYHHQSNLQNFHPNPSSTNTTFTTHQYTKEGLTNSGPGVRSAMQSFTNRPYDIQVKNSQHAAIHHSLAGPEGYNFNT